jgi:hypothetical protein
MLFQQCPSTPPSMLLTSTTRSVHSVGSSELHSRQTSWAGWGGGGQCSIIPTTCATSLISLSTIWNCHNQRQSVESNYRILSIWRESPTSMSGTTHLLCHYKQCLCHGMSSLLHQPKQEATAVFKQHIWVVTFLQAKVTINSDIQSKVTDRVYWTSSTRLGLQHILFDDLMANTTNTSNINQSNVIYVGFLCPCPGPLLGSH